MARSIPRHLRDDRQRDFVRFFDQVCRRHSLWTVWADFVIMSAAIISNSVDRDHAGDREKTYMDLAAKYDRTELECISKMFTEVVCGLEENPDQDFLGDLFMALKLGNEHKGQFFTPYSVCKMTAKMTYGKDLEEKIDRRGWVSVSDPACGAGAMLMAFANECKLQHTNYQTSVLFVAQDIDHIVGCMCYIQLSLLGCPGYVVIGNTLTEPCAGVNGDPLISVPRDNIWYTPMYFRDVWHYRRLGQVMNRVIRAAPQQVEPRYALETESAPEPEPPSRPAPQVLKENGMGQLTFF